MDNFVWKWMKWMDLKKQILQKSIKILFRVILFMAGMKCPFENCAQGTFWSFKNCAQGTFWSFENCVQGTFF